MELSFLINLRDALGKKEFDKFFLSLGHAGRRICGQSILVEVKKLKTKKDADYFCDMIRDATEG